MKDPIKEYIDKVWRWLKNKIMMIIITKNLRFSRRTKVLQGENFIKIEKRIRYELK